MKYETKCVLRLINGHCDYVAPRQFFWQFFQHLDWVHIAEVLHTLGPSAFVSSADNSVDEYICKRFPTGNQRRTQCIEKVRYTANARFSFFFDGKIRNTRVKSSMLWRVFKIIYKYICKRAKMYMCVCAVQGTYIQLNRDHINGDAPVTAKWETAY